MKSTQILALAALAATSCSLQLDSQYGLRWDSNVRVRKQPSPDPEHFELATATANLYHDGDKSITVSTSSINLDTEAWEYSYLPSATDNSGTTEEPTTSYPEIQMPSEATTAFDSSPAEQTAATNLEIESKNTLANLAGNVVMLLGAFFLLASFFTISVMSAYGASFAGVLFSLLLAGIGILLVVAGYRLRGR